MEMPNQDALDYYNAMISIEAEERIHLLNIADYPRMKETDRSKVFKNYNGAVYNKKVHTSEELEQLLKAKGLV